MRDLTVAHSPDADDAFMFYGVASGAVSSSLVRFVPEEADIESLNERAMRRDLDVTAISYAAWPRFADIYDLMPVGSSFGLGFGPRVIAREAATLDALADALIVIPGEMTTAALVLRLALPTCRTRVVAFDAIAATVAAGEADAGVVIHEGQLTHEREGLALVQDLGAWWMARTGLPLPLGANAVRRDVEPEAAREAARLLRRSIEHALAHREDAVRHALRSGRGRGLDLEMGLTYVGMYVNELSLDPGEEGRHAVGELYRQAHAAGLLPSPVVPRWSPA